LIYQPNTRRTKARVHPPGERCELSVGCVSHYGGRFSLTAAGLALVEGDSRRLQSQQADLSSGDTPSQSLTEPDVNGDRGRLYALPTGSESAAARVDRVRGAVAAVGTKAQPIYGCVSSLLGRLTRGIVA